MRALLNSLLWALYADTLAGQAQTAEVRPALTPTPEQASLRQPQPIARE